MDKAEQKRLLIEMMNEDAKDGMYLRTAEEILNQKDKDGIRKYWIGVYGSNKQMDLKDVLNAMEEYAEQFKPKKIKNELKYSTPEQLGQ